MRTASGLVAGVRRLAAWRGVVAAAVLAGGCSGKDITELLVEVQTDLVLPTEIDTVTVSVKGSDGATQEGQVVLTAPSTGAAVRQPPFTLGVVGASGRGSSVSVTARGLRNGRTIIERRVETEFVAGDVRRVPLALLGRCLGVTCESATQTCGEAGCVPAALPGTLLPRWTGTVPKWTSPDPFVRAVRLTVTDTATLEQTLAQVRDAGFDTVVATSTIPPPVGLLEALGRHGLRGILLVWQWSNERCAPDTDAAEVAAALQMNATNPGLFGWLMGLSVSPERCSTTTGEPAAAMRIVQGQAVRAAPGALTLTWLDAAPLNFRNFLDVVDVVALDPGALCDGSRCQPERVATATAAAQNQAMRRFWVVLRDDEGAGTPRPSETDLGKAVDGVFGSRAQGYIVDGWQSSAAPIPGVPGRLAFWKQVNQRSRP